MALERKINASAQGADPAPHSSDAGHASRPRDDSAGFAAPARPVTRSVLHWPILFCATLAVAFGLIRLLADGRMLRMWLLDAHRNFGLFVLVLLFLGVGFRLRSRGLPRADKTSSIIRGLASANQAFLYVLLLAQPLFGWALRDAQAKPVHLLGVALPAIVKPNAELADALQMWHQNIAWLLLGLVSLHAAAALWHRFILRDGVLRAMLPARGDACSP